MLRLFSPDRIAQIGQFTGSEYPQRIVYQLLLNGISLQFVIISILVFRYMNGIVNIYKPTDVAISLVVGGLKFKLSQALNRMKTREPRRFCDGNLKFLDSPDGNSSSSTEASAVGKIDLSDHELVAGPRYIHDEIKIYPIFPLLKITSGVQLLGFNNCYKEKRGIMTGNPMQVFHVTGKMGAATVSHFKDSRKSAHAAYDHVKATRLSAVAATLQASHQRKMYNLCGLDVQSQAAYDLACKGPIRPEGNAQVLYGMKLVNFHSPYFTLEIHCINGFEEWLAALVHEVALEAKTLAFCTQIRCLRIGAFTAENALLRHNWDLQNIMRNLSECRQVLAANPRMLGTPTPTMIPMVEPALRQIGEHQESSSETKVSRLAAGERLSERDAIISKIYKKRESKASGKEEESLNTNEDGSKSMEKSDNTVELKKSKVIPAPGKSHTNRTSSLETKWDINF